MKLPHVTLSSPRGSWLQRKFFPEDFCNRNINYVDLVDAIATSAKRIFLLVCRQYRVSVKFPATDTSRCVFSKYIFAKTFHSVAAVYEVDLNKELCWGTPTLPRRSRGNWSGGGGGRSTKPGLTGWCLAQRTACLWRRAQNRACAESDSAAWGDRRRLWR